MTLRPDQRRLLARHRSRWETILGNVGAVIASGGPSWKEEVRAALQQPREMLVSVAVCAVEAECERHNRFRERAKERRGGVVRIGAADVAPGVILGSLRRRKLPWDPADVEVMLDLSAGTAVNALAFRRRRGGSPPLVYPGAADGGRRARQGRTIAGRA